MTWFLHYAVAFARNGSSSPTSIQCLSINLSYTTVDTLTLPDKPNGVLLAITRGFTNLFSRGQTSFSQAGKTFWADRSSLEEKLSSKWLNMAGKTDLTAGQFVWFLALDETPEEQVWGQRKCCLYLLLWWKWSNSIVKLLNTCQTALSFCWSWNTSKTISST